MPLSTDRPKADEFIDIRVSVGWTRISRDVAERALVNSLHVVCLRDGDRLVGFGRIVGDRAMRFYIEDVAVVPEFQRRGLGVQIMDELMSWIELNVPAEAKIYLMAAKGSALFYERYGFRQRDENEPGMWRSGA